MPTPVADLIERLDKLDGVEDGAYSGFPLHVENATGTCETMEIVRQQMGTAKVIYKAQVVNPSSGKTTYIDCDELVKKMDAFIKIAEKIPATKFIAESSKRKQQLQQGAKPDPLPPIPSKETFFGFHLADHMITALLLGISTADESYQQLFSHISFSMYSGSVRNLGQLLSRPDFQAMNVTDVYGAFNLFKNLGRQYGFSVDAFAPPPKSVK